MDNLAANFFTCRFCSALHGMPGVALLNCGMQALKRLLEQLLVSMFRVDVVLLCTWLPPVQHAMLVVFHDLRSEWKYGSCVRRVIVLWPGRSYLSAVRTC